MISRLLILICAKQKWTDMRVVYNGNKHSCRSFNVWYKDKEKDLLHFIMTQVHLIPEWKNKAVEYWEDVPDENIYCIFIDSKEEYDRLKTDFLRIKKETKENYEF